MKNKIRLEMHEKLMNKSQYFENKIYYGISFDELYPICKKYGFDYSTVFDYTRSFPHIHFMGTNYFKNKEDAEAVIDYIDGLIVMEKLLK